jgi:hypothetical protein
MYRSIRSGSLLADWQAGRFGFKHGEKEEEEKVEAKGEGERAVVGAVLFSWTEAETATADVDCDDSRLMR